MLSLIHIYNPKTLNALIKKLKVFYKDKPDIDPYKMAYGLIPVSYTQLDVYKRQDICTTTISRPIL